MKGQITDKLQTALLSVATTGVIGSCAFLWNVSTTLAKLQERDTENIKAREEISIRINNMQIDIRDIRERLIRVELKSRQ